MMKGEGDSEHCHADMNYLVAAFHELQCYLSPSPPSRISSKEPAFAVIMRSAL